MRRLYRWYVAGILVALTIYAIGAFILQFYPWFFPGDPLPFGNGQEAACCLLFPALVGGLKSTNTIKRTFWGSREGILWFDPGTPPRWLQWTLVSVVGFAVLEFFASRFADLPRNDDIHLVVSDFVLGFSACIFGITYIELKRVETETAKGLAGRMAASLILGFVLSVFLLVVGQAGPHRTTR